MILHYFDASALVKYYVTEPGGTWVRQIIDAQDPEPADPATLSLSRKSPVLKLLPD
jgi:hypothetical protein